MHKVSTEKKDIADTSGRDTASECVRRVSVKHGMLSGRCVLGSGSRSYACLADLPIA